LYPAARLALFYVVLTGPWILLADNLLAMVMMNTRYLVGVRWAFLAAAATLFYLFVRREWRARERLEAERRATELRFAGILDAAADAIVIVDHGLALRRFNQRAEQMFGYRAAEALGQPLSLLFPPRLAEDYLRYIRAFALGPETSRLLNRDQEVFVRRKDGAEFPVEVSLSRLDQSGGSTLTFIVRDITERKWAEDALRSILEGTASDTGDNFFRSLVRHLAAALQMRYAFVAECTDATNTRVRTLAFWMGRDFGENFDYALVGTPCEGVIGGDICYHPSQLRALFPEDQDLVKLCAESYLGVPIFDSRGGVIGHLAALDDKPLPDNPRGVSILKIFATRAGAEMERKRASAQLARTARQLAALGQMGRTILASLDLQEVFAHVIEQVRQLLAAQDVYILLREGRELVFAAVGGPSAAELQGRRVPEQTGVAGQVVQGGQPVRGFCGLGDIPVEGEPEALLAVPLKLGEDIIGVMEAVHPEPQTFDGEALSILEAAASWATIAIDHARQHAHLRRRLQESESLAAINEALNSTVDLERIFQMIVNAVGQIIPQVKRAVIHVLDEQQQTLRAMAAAGVEEPGLSGFIMRPGEGVAGLVIEAGAVINVRDIRTDARYRPFGAQTLLRSLLVAPVQSGPHRLGTLSAQSEAPNAFSQADEHLLAALGIQAGLAVEKAWLLQTEREQRQLAEALRDVGAALSASLELDVVLDRLLEQAARVVPYDSANIMLVEDGLARITRAQGYERVGPQVAEAVFAVSFDVARTEALRWMAETGRPLVIPDVTAYPDWVRRDTSAHVRSWAGAPMVVDGQVLAFFSLDKREAGFYHRGHAERLAAFASQAALALQNARLFEATRRQLEELTVLHAVAVAGTEAADEDALIERATGIIGETLYPDVFGVMLVDEAAGALRVHPSYRVSDEVKKLPIPLGRGVTGRVAVEGRSRLLLAVENDPDYFPAIPETNSEVCVPLKGGDRILGVINAESQRRAAFTPADERLLVTLAGHLAAAIENARLYADLEKALQQEKATRAQLVQSEKLAAMGRLIASVAHEVNNPLQVIQNVLYLTAQERGLGQQAREYLQVALAESERMAELLNRLRDTYRPAANQDFQPESLNALVEHMRQLMATHLRHNDVAFEFDPDPALPLVLGLRDQLKQAILNLSLNAVEAMPGGGRLTLRTRFRPERGEAWLSVTDTGVGIDPGALPNLFEPFFTTKESGTGLGLAITHDIVQRHGGRIEVESTVGQGTTFTVRLPVDQKFVTTPGPAALAARTAPLISKS
jgi:PAS domain S-box-containing protein